jgi:FkbM family methyltransferase
MGKFYSENNLDAYIREELFPDYTYQGIMVEVGGGLPDSLSCSKHFREHGWRTIVFEPNPYFYELFLEQNIECYNFACSDKDEQDVDFSVCENNSGLSFSSLEIRYDSFHPASMPISKVKVNTTRLDTFFKRKKIKKIDFMTIDTEGWELEVVSGFDSSQVDCKYIILENYQNNPNYDLIMGEIGYEKIHKINYDHIFSKVNPS